MIVSFIIMSVTAHAQFSDDYKYFYLGGEDGYVLEYSGCGNPAQEGGGQYKLSSRYGKNGELYLSGSEKLEVLEVLGSMTTGAKIKEAYGVDFDCLGYTFYIYNTEVHKKWKAKEAREKKDRIDKINSTIFQPK